MLQKVLVLAISITLIASFETLKAEAEYSNIPYTHLTFSREWGSTVCGHMRCKSQNIESYDGKSFNIHGLWPSGKESDQCFRWEKCRHEQYVQSEIDDDLLEWMNAHYVGMFSSSKYFRKHEYEKHGSCFNTKTRSHSDRENEFFSTIRDLSRRYNIVEAFNRAGMYPNDTKRYSYGQVKKALAKGFGNNDAEYTIRCRYKSGDKSVQYLETVQLYLHPETYELMKCPCRKSFECSNRKPIIWPATFEFNQANSEPVMGTAEKFFNKVIHAIEKFNE